MREIDASIKRLKKTTFFGRRFTRQQLSNVKWTVDNFPNTSRTEMAHTICEHLDWRTDSGANSVAACMKMLEELAANGVFELPHKSDNRPRGASKPIQRTAQGEPDEPIVAVLKDLEPIKLELVQNDAPRTLLWNELVDRYHYLGYRQPMGCHLRYFIVDAQGRRLGCVLFQQATAKLPCRDHWIGWHGQSYKKRLNRVINNARFLMFPWVEVSNLASKSLSLASRCVADHWQARWGVRPLLMETFIDPQRYSGSSYRASGWERIGETEKRWDKTQKDVYVKPLAENARDTLSSGKAKRSASKDKSESFDATSASHDRFVRMWRDFIDIVAEVADEYDRLWQKRKRVLSTMVVMLFVFRLVFSKNHQGYQTTINELWDQCRLLGVELPQPRPPVASSLCVARAKLDEQVFKDLHWRITAKVDEQSDDQHSNRHRWCGRRLLAVDGTKINLPVALVDHGYRVPTGRSHYPQGLVSCLYRVDDRVAVDFELMAHGDERKGACAHLKRVRAGEVVVYDRGYFSFDLLHQHVSRGIDCIFRLKRNTNDVLKKFIKSGDTDTTVMLSASAAAISGHGSQSLRPIRIRLVRYQAGGNEYYLATTLTDSRQFPLSALSDAYHGRWGIEEMYKTSKRLIEVEQFHSKSERGVKQELYAHFVLLALARSFGNEFEDHINVLHDVDEPKMRVNFKNVLVTMARNFEAVILGQCKLASTAVLNILQSIGNCVQMERPGRSYERLSKRPDERFRNQNRRTKKA